MASYRFEVKSGKKGQALEHSSYIMRNGRHRVREDLEDQGFGNMPAWAADDPRKLWRMADRYERANGAVYREIVIPLPSELNLPQRKELVKTLVEEFAGSKPHQYAVHAPMSSLAGLLNPHLHLMFTDRVPDGIEREPQRVFCRYNARHPNQGGWKKDSGGRNRLALRDEMIEKRKRCADLENAMLLACGHPARVDHRTLSEQGLARNPEHHLGQARIRRMTAKEKNAYVETRCASDQSDIRLPCYPMSTS